MSGAGRLSGERAEVAREPVTVPTLLGWRRTGLVLSVAGLLAFLAGFALVATTQGAAQVVGVVLVLGGGLGVVVGSAFLWRAWSDPLGADDPLVGRLRSVARAAYTGWCVAVLLRFAGRLLPDGWSWVGGVGWLGSAVGVAAVVAYLWLLVLVARWSPARV